MWSEFKFFFYFGERVECEFEVFLRMGGGNLYADAGFALRHHRVGEADDVNSLGQHQVGEFGGERGIAILPDRVEEFRDGVHRAIDYARALDCKQLNCLAGIAPADADVFELNEVLVENLRYAADALAKEGIRLLVEPINTIDIPGFFLSRTEQAAQIVADVGSHNLFIQYDIYHMQIMEGDIARSLQKHLARIAHVQLADNPGRNEPGTGEINYPFLFRHLDAIGYRGWVGCEYKPRTTTVDGLGWHAAQIFET